MMAERGDNAEPKTGIKPGGKVKFWKGNPGMKKGTKHKRTIMMERVAHRLGRRDAHPADFLLNVMESEDAPLEMRVDCAKELLSYLEAKQREPEPLNPESPEESVQAANATMEKLKALSKPLAPLPADPA